MKAALRPAVAEAPSADPVEAVARFVAGFTHRIKSPLTGVKGYGQLLEREEDGERRRHWGHRLEGSLEAVDLMIEGMRRYQVPAGLEPRELPLALTADAAWRLALQVTPGAAAKALALVNRLAPDAVFRGDPFHFRNLLVNLFQNAIDASPPGAAVEVSCEPGELLGVADAGPGLRGLSAAEITAPFFTTRPDRAGMGLAVAALVAADHGLVLDWIQTSPLGLRARVLRTTPSA